MDGVIVDSAPFHFQAWREFAAARGISLAPAQCLVIEDVVAGVEAAKRAGMKSIAVTNTLAREKLGSADRVVQSLEDVDLQMICKLLMEHEGAG